MKGRPSFALLFFNISRGNTSLSMTFQCTNYGILFRATSSFSESASWAGPARHMTPLLFRTEKMSLQVKKSSINSSIKHLPSHQCFQNSLSQWFRTRRILTRHQSIILGDYTVRLQVLFCLLESPTAILIEHSLQRERHSMLRPL